MAIAHAGDLTQAPERATPVSGERVLRSDAGPEPVAFADARARFERVNDEWRKRDVHRRVGLLGVEEKAITGQPVHSTTCGIADTQCGVPRKQDEGSQAACVLPAGVPMPVGVLPAGVKQGGHLVSRKRHGGRILNLGALELERQIFAPPTSIYQEPAKRTQALQLFAACDGAIFPLAAKTGKLRQCNLSGEL